MTVERRLRILSFGAESMRSETTVRVAFASSDMKHVDQHFGAAEAFVIHEVGMDRFNLVEVVQFGQTGMDGNEDKLAAKIAALDGCVAVYCQAVGASAVNQLLAKGVQPVKVSGGSCVSELLESLKEELRAGPSAWLARAIESRQPRSDARFDAMEADGWSE